MANRIPPSLNWLINKRARLAGEVQKTEKKLLKVQHLINKLKELENSLDAVDKALKLHEIEVDIENIKPIRSKPSRSKFRHGEINNLILFYLRSKSSNKSVSKYEISEYLSNKHLELDPQPLSTQQLSYCVLMSLNRLVALGCISRCHDPNTNKMGHWRANEKIDSP